MLCRSVSATVCLSVSLSLSLLMPFSRWTWVSWYQQGHKLEFFSSEAKETSAQGHSPRPAWPRAGLEFLGERAVSPSPPARGLSEHCKLPSEVWSRALAAHQFSRILIVQCGLSRQLCCLLLLVSLEQLLPRQELWRTTEVSASVVSMDAMALTRMSPFWILLALRMMEVTVTNGTIRCAKLQADHHL